MKVEHKLCRYCGQPMKPKGAKKRQRLSAPVGDMERWEAENG